MGRGSFLWAAFRAGLPSLWWVVGVAALLLGGSVLAYIAFALDRPQLAGLVLGAAVVLAVIEGGYRLWFVAETDRAEYEEAEAIRNDYDSLMEAVTWFNARGLDVISPKVDREDEGTVEYARAWLEGLRSFVHQTYGPGEYGYLQTKVRYEDDFWTQVEAAAGYTAELVEGRAGQRPIHSTFDPRPWIEAFEKSMEEPAEEDEPQEDQP